MAANNCSLPLARFRMEACTAGRGGYRTGSPGPSMRFLLAAAVALSAAPAFARCNIHNDSGESFTITSGNVSNQRIGSHTTSSIAAGTIAAKADSGKSVGGSCKDGDSVEIKEQGGVLVLTVK